MGTALFLSLFSGLLPANGQGVIFRMTGADLVASGHSRGEASPTLPIASKFPPRLGFVPLFRFGRLSNL